MKSEQFTAGEVISAGTGKLCCPLDGLYKILNYLTGDDLYTHQLPRAFRACESWVKQQCPWLNEINADGCNPDTWRDWLNKIEQAHGATHTLKPLPDGQWRSCDPVREAVEMMEDKSKVIVVRPPAANQGGV